MNKSTYYVLLVTFALVYFLVPQVVVPAWQGYLGYDYFVDHEGYWVDPVFVYSPEQVIYNKYTSTGAYRAEGNHKLHCWDVGGVESRSDIYSWQYDQWSYPLKEDNSVGSFRLKVPESAIGKECVWDFHVWIDTNRRVLFNEFSTNTFVVVNSS